CEEILDTLRDMNFAEVEEQGFMPLYTRNEIKDDLQMVCGFQTDFQFITKQKMKTIQKNSKGR
ncbi:MAG: transposase, partial [Butyrivibrio sp.]|nr:transposase [Butyrivibrio sp.]